jgi:hypothetical protein
MAANPEIERYIRDAARSRGIDENTAVEVARREALNVFDPSKPDLGGDDRSSFGVYQLHYGGLSKKMPNAGLGDEFTKATGLDARDPSTWKQQVDFSLDHAARNGWSAWMGADAAGIGKWQGIKPDAGAVGTRVANATGRYEPPVTTARAEATQPQLDYGVAGEPYADTSSPLADTLATHVRPDAQADETALRITKAAPPPTIDFATASAVPPPAQEPALAAPAVATPKSLADLFQVADIGQPAQPLPTVDYGRQYLPRRRRDYG